MSVELETGRAKRTAIRAPVGLVSLGIIGDIKGGVVDGDVGAGY